MDDLLLPEPKGRRWRTYDKLAAQHERYENIAKGQFFGWLSGSRSGCKNEQFAKGFRFSGREAAEG